MSRPPEAAADEGVKIYVLFYAREGDEPMKGIMGYFQDRLEYWHCEIAFPLNCFDTASLPAPPPKVPRDSLIWAYGIMNQTREPLPFGQVVFESNERVIVDPDVRKTAQSKRNYIQIDAGSLGVNRSTVLLDEYDAYGRKIKVQHKISKCSASSRWRFWGKDPLTTWPSGKQVLGPAEVRVRDDGLVQLVTPGTVFGKHRTFSKPNYKWITFLVPWTKASQAVRYCTAQVGKQYDHTGIKRSMFWPAKHTLNPDRMYCVNLVVTTLQQAGIARGLNPTGITTDDLYRVLTDHPGTKVKTLLPFNETQFLDTAASGRGDSGNPTPPARKKQRKRPLKTRHVKGSRVKMRTIREVENMV